MKNDLSKKREYTERSPRVDVHIEAALDDGRQYHLVDICNISESGLYIQSHHQLDFSNDYRLIPLGDNAIPEAEVKVIRSDHKNSQTQKDSSFPSKGLGLSFPSLTEGMSQQIRLFCAQQRQKKAGSKETEALQEYFSQPSDESSGDKVK